MGGDEFALANECPPIRISGDTQNKLFNKELVSRLPKSCVILLLTNMVDSPDLG